MTKADQAVESAADRIDAFVQESRAQGGVKAKIGEALAEDPEFLRKLKPSLVKARVKGETPPAAPPGGVPRTPPPAPQQSKRRRGGTSPWLVVGAALLAGYALAKIVDWRGHAHPRL